MTWNVTLFTLSTISLVKLFYGVFADSRFLKVDEVILKLNLIFFFKLFFQVRFKMELIPIKSINPNSHNHRHISNSRWILTYSSSNRQCNSKTDFISNLCEPVWSSLWKSLALKFSRFVRVQKLAATFSLFSKISNAIPFGHAHSSQHILAF